MMEYEEFVKKLKDVVFFSTIIIGFLILSFIFVGTALIQMGWMGLLLLLIAILTVDTSIWISNLSKSNVSVWYPISRILYWMHKKIS